jgi:hypothetical protein
MDWSIDSLNLVQDSSRVPTAQASVRRVHSNNSVDRRFLQGLESVLRTRWLGLDWNLLEYVAIEPWYSVGHSNCDSRFGVFLEPRSVARELIISIKDSGNGISKNCCH